MVVVENYPLDGLLNKETGLLDIVAYSIEEQTNYPLTLSINKLEHFSLTLTYYQALISKEQIKNMATHFINILKFINKESRESLEQLEILTKVEKNQILYQFNDTQADYPTEKTIHELFKEQVNRAPDNVAVLFKDTKLTYSELNEKANQQARRLREYGVQADSIVGIMVERSLEMIIGIMGIVKAGGAYLPIDPNYPKGRIEYMLEDSGSEVILSKESMLNHINFTGQVIDLSNEDLFTGDFSNLQPINNSRDLAYVIYTSGTTGNPKGAMIEHKALVNRLHWMQKKYPLNQDDIILQKTTYTFDVSVWEMFWWSVVGAKVCMLEPGYEKDPLKIIAAIQKYNITTIHFVPSMLDLFLYCLEENNERTNLPSLRQVFSSGEALKFSQASKFQQEFGISKKLINLYGPTEATIDVSYYDCDSQLKRPILIGKPIDNIQLYILNNSKLAPIGVQGELYIAGDGLARGYINRPELTAEKFVDNPFTADTKMYKTGDLARWLPDGNIDFLGRIDNQVKIRGFRIELGEIENRLLCHEDIKEVVVLARSNDANENYLCAYIVCKEEIDNLQLRTYLKDSLPEYMVPSYFVHIDKMPLTANGKVNRNALPEPNINEVLSSKYEAPRNKTEEKLVEIWCAVLGVEEVGINDNFFDLGGHSLKATIMISKIHKELNAELQLKDLFKSATIKGISNYLASSSENMYSAIEQAEEKEYYCYKTKKMAASLTRNLAVH